MSGTGIFDGEDNEDGSKTVLLELLCKSRRNELKLSTKYRLLSQSRVIEAKALRMLNERPHYERPYGLPRYWSESGREQIWENILKFVCEPQDVINLSEVSVLLRRLVQGKYRAVRLAKVAQICVKKGRLPPEILLNLRLVNRTAKYIVDKRVMIGSLKDCGCCVVYQLRGLTLAAHMEQPRLHNLITSLEGLAIYPGKFPLRRVHLEEREGLDLRTLRNSVGRLFELVGGSIHSLVYLSQQDSHDTYNILRNWVSLLPNLEEMFVEIDFPNGTALIKPFEPFPTISRLKRFCVDGLYSYHSGEIIRMNPTLQQLKMEDPFGDDLDYLITEGILDQRQLNVLSHSTSSLVPFLEHRVTWPLKKLDLTMNAVDAGVLFKFINQFGLSLKTLKVIAELRETRSGETLDLPNLTELEWFLQADSQTLNFMFPLKNLKYFDIHVPPNLGSEFGMEGTLKYLETFHIPRLYPAMKRICALKNVDGEEWQIIWKRGGGILYE